MVTICQLPAISASERVVADENSVCFVSSGEPANIQYDFLTLQYRFFSFLAIEKDSYSKHIVPDDKLAKYFLSGNSYKRGYQQVTGYILHINSLTYLSPDHIKLRRLNI
jgi:hypothetical protein